MRNGQERGSTQQHITLLNQTLSKFDDVVVLRHVGVSLRLNLLVTSLFVLVVFFYVDC